MSYSIQATSRLCWFSLSFFASSPPRIFLKFMVCSLTHSFPIRILLLHSQNPLDVTPRCMAEILLTNIFSFRRLSLLDPVFFTFYLSVCVCLCKLSLLNHTIIVYFHKMEESTIQCPPQYLKTRGFQRTRVDTVTLHCTDAQARCFCQKVLIQNTFLNSLKCSWCCSGFDHSCRRETFTSHKPREVWHFCWSSKEHKTRRGAISAWIFFTVFNCASGLLMRAITVCSEATLLKSS